MGSFRASVSSKIFFTIISGPQTYIMSKCSLSSKVASGWVTRHCSPAVPSSVVVMMFFSWQMPLISCTKRSSLAVLAPSTNMRRSVFAESCFARKSRGAVPVPPPTSRIRPRLSVKLLPNGPRMPIVAPGAKLCRWRVASPIAFTVTEITPFEVSIILSGISSMPGIQSIKNCPGLALLHNLSMNMKVLVEGLSVRICTICVVLSWLFAVGKSDNIFHTPSVFLSQIILYSFSN